MKSANYILGNIRANGYRLTEVRRAVLDVLIKHAMPLSAMEIKEQLAEKDIVPNKTTVYRELTFLKTQGMIKELQFGDLKKRYEIMPDNHHHHIVCLTCEKVEDVVMDNDLIHSESAISREKKFKILNHSLEFYGICKDCQ